MKYALIILVFGLCACALPSAMNPVEWFSADPPATPTPPPPPGGATVGFWMDILIRFGWFGIVLMFVVPGVRTPFIALWTAIFRVFTIPFDFMHMKWADYKLRKLTQRDE